MTSTLYAPGPYRCDDPDALAAVIASYPLATLVATSEDGPVAAYAPLVLRSEGASRRVLIGHVARANPFWKVAHGARVLVVWSGPSAYVSASVYPSKAAHGKAVPTWCYVRVEARGHATIETDPARLDDYVDAPTTMMEARRADPWSTADAPAAWIAALKHAIVGVRIDVTSLDGAFKLDQKKPDADARGAADALDAEGHADLAAWMRRARR